jgi:hypothetical protein
MITPASPEVLTQTDIETVILAVGYAHPDDTFFEDDLVAILDKVAQLKISAAVFNLLIEGRLQIKGLDAQGELVFEARA